MADATGKFESGLIDGNAVHEGRYLQCLRVNDGIDTTKVEPLYCSAFWNTLLPTFENPPKVRMQLFENMNANNNGIYFANAYYIHAIFIPSLKTEKNALIYIMLP